ncbi:TIGR01244 family sulfur transferase [Paraherbaspirillum soli]|uniref:TIGR01244 family sulfur transferase n=1 Tax=Paraherbaspirillum soli TaxID=631222 RepID=A0ABW0M7Z1_9BURK
MHITISKHSDQFSTAGQIKVEDLTEIAAAGYQSVICNRPDAEDGASHAGSAALATAAGALGLKFAYLPVVANQITAQDGAAMQQLLDQLPAPVLAFCRSGNRSTNLYRLAQASAAETATAQIGNRSSAFEVVIVGGGSAGIGIAASLLRRRPDLQVAIIEPSDHHYYQPAWTLVGGGAFDIQKTVRPMRSVIPEQAHWIQAAASAFEPDHNRIKLADGSTVHYKQLIVCPGLRLAWEKIEGLEQTLGKNGVTSNYRYDLAPYTWQLVSSLKQGTALFSQPGMPIKCAGAPQKALYLSCDHWLRSGVLNNLQIEFNNASAVLFGVAAFVPPLMKYVEKYNAKLSFNSNLVKVDGERKLAWFDVKDQDGHITRQEKSFDMLHVVPPQVAPEVVRNSPLADAGGWCEVDQATLRHPRYANVFALGDACSAPNAKTVAAARKQIVVVAENLIAARENRPLATVYDGYGACPLTVEKGKVLLAEFGYGGKLLPTFPLDPTVARGSNWFLKVSVLPWVYWNAMLKGREWLARPTKN